MCLLYTAYTYLCFGVCILQMQAIPSHPSKRKVQIAASERNSNTHTHTHTPHHTKREERRACLPHAHQNNYKRDILYVSDDHLHTSECFKTVIRATTGETHGCLLGGQRLGDCDAVHSVLYVCPMRIQLFLSDLELWCSVPCSGWWYGRAKKKKKKEKKKRDAGWLEGRYDFPRLKMGSVRVQPQKYRIPQVQNGICMGTATDIPNLLSNDWER